MKETVDESKYIAHFHRHKVTSSSELKKKHKMVLK